VFVIKLLIARDCEKHYKSCFYTTKKKAIMGACGSGSKHQQQLHEEETLARQEKLLKNPWKCIPCTGLTQNQINQNATRYFARIGAFNRPFDIILWRHTPHHGGVFSTGNILSVHKHGRKSNAFEFLGYPRYLNQRIKVNLNSKFQLAIYLESQSWRAELRDEGAVFVQQLVKMRCWWHCFEFNISIQQNSWPHQLDFDVPIREQEARTIPVVDCIKTGPEHRDCGFVRFCTWMELDHIQRFYHVLPWFDQLDRMLFHEFLSRLPVCIFTKFIVCIVEFL
jgi:hypothetical protein